MVEIVTVDQEIITGTLPTLAFARIGIAARIDERNPLFLTSGCGIGIDLEITRFIFVGFVESDDVPIAGVLGYRYGSREGEDAGGVCVLGGASQRGEGEQSAGSGAGFGQAGDAALRDADSERLQLDQGGLGKHRSAGEPDEFRAGVDGGQAAGGSSGLEWIAGREGGGDAGFVHPEYSD